MKYLTNIGNIALRELDIIIRKNRIYGFCMVVFPVLLVVFFTTMLDDGVALDLPVGVVDQDNSATSRGLIRNLDAMQSSRVVYRFANVTEARNAMQEGKVYAYLLIPEGTSAKLLAGNSDASWNASVCGLDHVEIKKHSYLMNFSSEKIEILKTGKRENLSVFGDMLWFKLHKKRGLTK